MVYNNLRVWVLCATCIVAAAGAATAGAADDAARRNTDDAAFRNTQENRDAEKLKRHEPDFSGKKRVGKASFYAKQFAGKPMADGAPMDPQANNAASKTLPLGTTAKVTNLETGRSAVVTIRDRGPYVPGRIVDLSPATARQIGITPRKGVAPVVVAPITVPQPDGGIKLGAAVHEALFDSSQPLREAEGPLREAKGQPLREAKVPLREATGPIREATADVSTLHTR
jgi:rare lipoprotein A